MKFDDLNDNLNEGPISGPAGFTKRAKAKLQKNAPFAKQQRRRGAAKDELFKKAKEIKDDFKQWVDTKTGSSNINNAGITMPEFLTWMQSETEFGSGAEKFARGDKAYKDYFSQEVDSEGDQTSTASDEKVTKRTQDDKNQPGKVSDEEKAAGYAKIAADAEAEAKELGSEDDDDTQDLKASKGDDKEPKVDTSASIYESRFHAMLKEDAEDVGVNSAKTLQDNQIDTLIVGAIRAGKSALGQKKEQPEQRAVADKQEVDPKADKKAAKAAAKVGKPGKAKAAASSGGLSDDDVVRLKNELDKMGDQIYDVIRKNIEDESVKKKIISEIEDILITKINNSF